MPAGKTREEYNAYMREYMKKYAADRRAEAVIQLGSKCFSCGGTDRLEFDHVDRTDKGFSIGKIWGHSKEKLQTELKKCQLLCHDCHKQKTQEEFSVPHGGGVSGKKNCPCILCKQKKAEYMAEYNKHRVR